MTDNLPPIVHHPLYRETPPARRGSRGNKSLALWRQLREAGLLGPVHSPAEPAPRWWLTLVHEAAYVDQVLEDRLPDSTRRRIGLNLTPAFIERVRAHFTSAAASS